MEIYYCADGNKKYAEIAINEGMKYGARLPANVYFKPEFVDQDWKKPDRAKYMASLKEHQPTRAIVLDLERVEQLAEVLSWAEEASQYASSVVIIPKAHGVVKHLPKQINSKPVVLGYSVPTGYGGTELMLNEFAGWDVHLLGGSPLRQRKYYQYLAAVANVVSADGNYHQKIAANCKVWASRTGVYRRKVWDWIPLEVVQGFKLTEDANYKAFELSCQNILEMWREIGAIY